MRSTDITAALAALAPVAAASRQGINVHWGQNENARRLATICENSARPEFITLSGACVDPYADPTIDCDEVLSDVASCQARGVKVLVQASSDYEGQASRLAKAFPSVDGFALSVNSKRGKCG